MNVIFNRIKKINYIFSTLIFFAIGCLIFFVDEKNNSAYYFASFNNNELNGVFIYLNNFIAHLKFLFGDLIYIFLASLINSLLFFFQYSKLKNDLDKLIIIQLVPFFTIVTVAVFNLKIDSGILGKYFYNLIFSNIGLVQVYSLFLISFFSSMIIFFRLGPLIFHLIENFYYKISNL